MSNETKIRKQIEAAKRRPAFIKEAEELARDEMHTEAGDMVNSPQHYRNHPSGIECIQVTEHMSFNLGNAVKYIWRADEKGKTLEDLKKAAWYIEREIKRRGDNHE